MTNSEKRATASKQFCEANPEPETLIFDPSPEWLGWSERKAAFVSAACPWDESDEASLASRGTRLNDGTITY